MLSTSIMRFQKAKFMPLTGSRHMLIRAHAEARSFSSVTQLAASCICAAAARASRAAITLRQLLFPLDPQSAGVTACPRAWKLKS